MAIRGRRAKPGDDGRYLIRAAIRPNYPPRGDAALQIAQTMPAADRTD
jgi:hypothetical protein